MGWRAGTAAGGTRGQTRGRGRSASAGCCRRARVAAASCRGRGGRARASGGGARVERGASARRGGWCCRAAWPGWCSLQRIQVAQNLQRCLFQKLYRCQLTGAQYVRARCGLCGSARLALGAWRRTVVPAPVSVSPRCPGAFARFSGAYAARRADGYRRLIGRRRSCFLARLASQVGGPAAESESAARRGAIGHGCMRMRASAASCAG